MSMKKVYVKLLFIVFLTAFLQLNRANAQCDPETDPDCPGDDPDAIPLDPGTWVLVAAGAGYGIKRWRDFKTANKEHIINTVDYIQKTTTTENL